VVESVMSPARIDDMNRDIIEIARSSQSDALVSGFAILDQISDKAIG